MKISVSTYSYQKLIDSKQISQLDCIKIARNMGFDAIEIMDIYPHDGSSHTEYAEKIAEECRKLNFPIVNYTIGADFINGSNGDFEAEIERLKKQIDIASVLETRGVRHDATLGFDWDTAKHRGFQDALPVLIEGCRRVTDYAAKKGIKTMVENHGFFCQDSERVEKLVNGVADKNFGLLTDMGNFLCADEAPEIAFGRVAPYAFYVHAKDFYVKSGMHIDPGEGFFKSRGGNYLRGAIIGHGDVPVLQCLAILKSAGYDGCVGIEFEGLEEPLKAIEIGYKNLRRFIDIVDNGY
ncbi:MAG: hypothetical protein K0R50_2320 [Eubacterium sp.]|nr:hypothetical protein [Eubacterium sp.]